MTFTVSRSAHVAASMHVTVSKFAPKNALATMM